MKWSPHVEKEKALPTGRDLADDRPALRGRADAFLVGDDEVDERAIAHAARQSRQAGPQHLPWT